MPLLDHFRPPISTRHGWEAFHVRWAVAIADDLNARLPGELIAEAPAHLGASVAADVAEFEGTNGHPSPSPRSTGGGVAVATDSPPAADHRLPFTYLPEFAVEVRDESRGRMLLAVVELVSPANKDRPDTREGFAAKVASYLHAGVGLIVADIVTVMRFNLHNEFVRLGGHPDVFRMPDAATIYATGYRPGSRKGVGYIDIWTRPLAVGGPLPVLPLALRGRPPVSIDLEATYADACRLCRLA